MNNILIRKIVELIEVMNNLRILNSLKIKEPDWDLSSQKQYWEGRFQILKSEIYNLLGNE